MVRTMTRIQRLACLWTLVFAQTGFVFSDVQFIERNEGEAVVLPCVTVPSDSSTVGVYLKRSWLNPGEVLFKYTNLDFSLANPADKSRIRVSGDPSTHSLNVSISELRAADTDRYFCQFVVNMPFSEDKLILGQTEFFLLVHADAQGPVDTQLVQTCAGGSAVLPCDSPRGEDAVVEGVSLKRQKSRAPVEVVYHSKLHRPPSHAHLPAERVHLSFALGSGGITYNVTLQQLQPEDSGLYSCQLLLRGRPDSSSRMGRRGVFVSVQGDQCGCSRDTSGPSNQHTIVLYILSAAVGVLLLILIVFFISTCKASRSAKSSPQAPIYEEMVGMQSPSRKLGPLHVEDADSEYRNCSGKKSCPENHYESPTGSLFPRRASAMKP